MVGRLCKKTGVLVSKFQIYDDKQLKLSWTSEKQHERRENGMPTVSPTPRYHAGWMLWWLRVLWLPAGWRQGSGCGHLLPPVSFGESVGVCVETLLPVLCLSILSFSALCSGAATLALRTCLLFLIACSERLVALTTVMGTVWACGAPLVARWGAGAAGLTRRQPGLCKGPGW